VLRWSETSGPATLAVTGRAGGSSGEPWRGLNLGDHVGDDPAAVSTNRAQLAEHIGVGRQRLLFARQVHGCRVVTVDEPWPGDPPEADALVTRTPGLAVGVLVADCVPVLLHAPAEGVVGVAHAGRRGMVGGVVQAAVASMRELGATGVRAVVGPSICPRCYEVPAELRDDVAAAVPVAASVTRVGRPSVDVAAGVLEQAAGVCQDVAQLPGCSAEDDDLFSYRRDGVTGRFAGVAWLGAAS
jgi:polyphenol oxidase